MRVLHFRNKMKMINSKKKSIIVYLRIKINIKIKKENGGKK